MHERFTALMKQVKPIPHDIKCIQILKRVKPALDYHRLMVKNEGNKHEKTYRSKRYLAEKETISSLDYYIKNQTQ